MSHSHTQILCTCRDKFSGQSSQPGTQPGLAPQYLSTGPYGPSTDNDNHVDRRIILNTGLTQTTKTDLTNGQALRSNQLNSDSRQLLIKFHIYCSMVLDSSDNIDLVSLDSPGSVRQTYYMITGTPSILFKR